MFDVYEPQEVAKYLGHLIEVDCGDSWDSVFAGRPIKGKLFERYEKPGQYIFFTHLEQDIITLGIGDIENIKRVRHT